MIDREIKIEKEFKLLRLPSIIIRLMVSSLRMISEFILLLSPCYFFIELFEFDKFSGEEVKPRISPETSTVGTQVDESIRTETEDVAELRRKFEEEKDILVHNLYSLLVTARYQIGNLKKENKKLEAK